MVMMVVEAVVVCRLGCFNSPWPCSWIVFLYISQQTSRAFVRIFVLNLSALAYGMIPFSMLSLATGPLHIRTHW